MTAKSSFLIRDVTVVDVEELSTLAHRIWREHYTPIIGNEQVEYMLGLWYSPEFLTKQVLDESRLFLTAQVAGELKGYIQSSEQESHSFIHKLYIAPESQGQGLGKALLGALPKGLPLSLRVNRDNHNSIAFYQHCGFKIVAEDVLDIGQGFVMDDYAMQRSI